MIVYDRFYVWYNHILEALYAACDTNASIEVLVGPCPNYSLFVFKLGVLKPVAVESGEFVTKFGPPGLVPLRQCLVSGPMIDSVAQEPEQIPVCF